MTTYNIYQVIEKSNGFTKLATVKKGIPDFNQAIDELCSKMKQLQEILEVSDSSEMLLSDKTSITPDSGLTFNAAVFNIPAVTELVIYQDDGDNCFIEIGKIVILRRLQPTSQQP